MVELAPALRGGGQNVDFRGRTHLSVLERMGVLDELRTLDTGGSPMTFLGADGRRLLHLPAEFAGGELEIPRGELAQLLYRHSLSRAEYVFGDSITALEETPGGVRVAFRHGAPREFDLVIGADGLHSNVRRLAFGPEQRYVRHLGYYAATWQLPGGLGLPPGSVGLNVPGRLVSVGADHRDPTRAGAFCLFASPELRYDRHDVEQQKALVRDAFAGLGWEVPRLLESLRGAPSCTSTRSAAPTSPPGPAAGSPCSATRPAAPPSAAWAPVPPWWPRTSWRASWPGPAGTTAPPSPGTRGCCAATPRGARRVGTARARSWRRAPPPACGCATDC